MGGKPRRSKRPTIAQAMAAIADHEARYGVEVPQALRDFYGARFQRFDARYTPPMTPPGFEEAHFRLLLTPPNWRGVGDDAVNILVLGPTRLDPAILPRMSVASRHGF